MKGDRNAMLQEASFLTAVHRIQPVQVRRGTALTDRDCRNRSGRIGTDAPVQPGGTRSGYSRGQTPFQAAPWGIKLEAGIRYQVLGIRKKGSFQPSVLRPEYVNDFETRIS